ncbi:MAG: transcriptional repressor LexA [Planctomycetota bacterium]|jgi:repressor LexA
MGSTVGREIWKMPLKAQKLTSRVTPRQVQLLRMIARVQASQCYSPTIGELACELGVSRSTTFEHIGELRRKGLVSACPGRARSLRLTSKGQELLDAFGESDSPSYVGVREGVPLVGRVAAGSPIEAIEEKEYLSLSSHFGGSDDTFALEVRGDSMIADDIRDGDYVICRRSCLADDGQLVVAIVDNENATLKRFYKEKTRARLEPANDDYEAIYSNNCRIEGIVIGLVRRL